ncbi:MAG TPA: hypothetical protein VGO40_04940 [Longimicrobium sp.]|jgi:hypothetical protein|nr:hypothetical protein [Longimicrobium sp.]
MRARSRALLAASAALLLAAARTAVAQHGAAGCRRTDPVRTFTLDGTTNVDLRRPATFRCTLHAGGPVRRVVLAGNAVDGSPETLRIGGPHPQAFRLGEANTTLPAGSPYLRAEDLNRDGWTDLMVLLTTGVNGQEWYAVFLYAPGRGRFVEDDTIFGSANIERIAGRPCVRSTENYLYLLTWEEYCWRGGRWSRVRDVRREFPAAGVEIRTRRTFHRGRRTEVTVDTLREAGR